jgi:hypothetical protein
MTTDEILPPWTADATSASGQVFEFRLWALLTEQSRGRLHVFLPLADRGIDALVHRLGDDAYIPVQAKGRSTLTEDGEVHVNVWVDSLRDDKALVVSGLVTEGGLGPTMLVIPEGEFKRLAYLSSDRGRPLFSAEFGMRPRSDSKWLPWLVPTEHLAERFGISRPAEELVEKRPPDWRTSIGFLGESEVVRLLAESGDLNLFRPFPDSETAELLVLHVESRRVIGLQIKTVEVSKERMRATVEVYASSFRSSATTFLVVLAFAANEPRFHANCLLIPSNELPSVTHDDHAGHWYIDWQVASAGTIVEKYRHITSDLRTAITQLLR